LEFLKEMKQLEWCDISNTDIDSGLEYLPKGVENFRCLTNYRPDAKVQVFNRLLEQEKDNKFSHKLQSYKQEFRAEVQVQQTKLNK
jgi:hypothetical protein